MASESPVTIPPTIIESMTEEPSSSTTTTFESESSPTTITSTSSSPDTTSADTSPTSPGTDPATTLSSFSTSFSSNDDSSTSTSSITTSLMDSSTVVSTSTSTSTSSQQTSPPNETGSTVSSDTSTSTTSLDSESSTVVSTTQETSISDPTSAGTESTPTSTTPPQTESTAETASQSTTVETSSTEPTSPPTESASFTLQSVSDDSTSPATTAETSSTDLTSSTAVTTSEVSTSPVTTFDSPTGPTSTEATTTVETTSEATTTFDSPTPPTSTDPTTTLETTSEATTTFDSPTAPTSTDPTTSVEPTSETTTPITTAESPTNPTPTDISISTTESSDTQTSPPFTVNSVSEPDTTSEVTTETTPSSRTDITAQTSTVTTLSTGFDTSSHSTEDSTQSATASDAVTDSASILSTLTAPASTLTVASGSGPSAITLVSASGVDLLTQAATSEFNVFTQSALEAVSMEALTLTSQSVATLVTTEFSTSTLPDGSTTLVPTRTNTITTAVGPTSHIQPNDFERNKGSVIGVIVGAVLLILAVIGAGLWLCKRRRHEVRGRSVNPSAIGDVKTGRVLIRGHDLPSGRPLDQQWRPPLVQEVGDEDEELYNRSPMDAGSSEMSQRGGFRDLMTIPMRRSNSYGSAEEGMRTPTRRNIEITSMSSSNPDTMEFTTSLLSFEPSDDDHRRNPGVVVSRFSDASSSHRGARTESLISLSAEPTPLDSRFSVSGTSENGTIPIISPFADTFSVSERERNTYWQDPSRSSMTSHKSESSSSSETGWNQIDFDDEPPSRLRGGMSSSPFITQDVLYQPADPFDDEYAPSLMSQISMITSPPPAASSTSLLNPPLRPQFTGTLSDLAVGQRVSRAPTLPPIPQVATPSTDNSFHFEGLVADPFFAQSRIEGPDTFERRESKTSLLDHVDYSMPIAGSAHNSMGSAEFEGITFKSRSEHSSLRSVTPTTEQEHDQDRGRDMDLLNDVGPFMSVLRRAVQSSKETLPLP